ncbi:MAG: sigma-70 family RNA polymerase sigma factor [Treponema sp.]|nr:sigma-70 family RNA polymerase sigma factor [Treponema sp.]
MKTEPVLEEQIVPQVELAALVKAAKTDKHTLNTLLHDYMPFIKKCVASVFLKGQSKEDSLTDAMLAFAHSVQTYNPEQGAFIQYAATVIRNRLIDNIRKELSAQKRFISLNTGTDEIDMVWENAVSLQAYDRGEEERNMRLEIEAVNGEFAQWGFSWETLLRKCPKQERSRRAALRIARTVLRDPALLAETLRTRQLPLSRLVVVFPRKALEKYRQYIAALIVISQGDYPYLYSFVPHPFDEEENT